MFDLAGAVFEAARRSEPTPETILFLDGLLKNQQPEPLIRRNTLSPATGRPRPRHRSRDLADRDDPPRPEGRKPGGTGE